MTTFRCLRWLIQVTLVAAVGFAANGAAFADLLAKDDFERGLERWRLEPPGQFEILVEPGTSNHVLQLTPKQGTFAHALIEGSDDYSDIRVEGRFLFPTEGDGYLGFLYNYQQTEERMDFGCLYVKSNGSYVRVSPHYDGNPSWRLHPEMQFDLEGKQQIRTGTWYDFRLDVVASRATLYIEDLSSPVATYDMLPNEYGAIGLEARPGGGQPAWVDDIRVSKLEYEVPDSSADVTVARLADNGAAPLDWEIFGPIRRDGTDLGEGSNIVVDSFDYPELPTDGWRPIEPDARGMVLTGSTTQFRSGDRDIAFLRANYEIASDAVQAPNVLVIAAANRIDVWHNGDFLRTVAPEEFIWPDYLDSPEHPGVRLPIEPRMGVNELVLRVHGRRFAGGGFYAALTMQNAREEL
jgi:hypothetical protein